jgi:hypothetical protein
MRQVHRTGVKLFVDFSGRRPHFIDRRTGEVIVVTDTLGRQLAQKRAECLWESSAKNPGR